MTFCCALCHATDIPRSKKKRDLCEDCVPSLAARGLAWCTKGKHRVQQRDIAKAKDKTWCFACKHAAAAAWPSSRKRGAYAKDWRARNPDKVRAYSERPDVQTRRRELKHTAYWRNPDRARQMTRLRDARRREKRIHAARLWRQNNPGYGARQYRMKKLSIIRAAWRQ